MARPSEFKGQTRVLRAPADNPEVLPLPVLHKGDTALPGAPAIISAWQLTPEELEEVKRTGVVFLAVLGVGMPPAYVGSSLADCLEVAR